MGLAGDLDERDADGGEHHLRLVFASGIFASLDGMEVITAAVTLSEGIYDDTNLGLSYSGSWQSMTGVVGPYLETLRYSYRVGDAVQAYFTGRQIKLSYFAGPDAGVVDVYVDGVKVASLDEHSSSWDWQATWTSELLSVGDHSLRIEYRSGGFVSLDALEAIAAPVVLTNGKYDDADLGLSYSGSWQSMSGVVGPYQDTLRYSYRVGDAVQAYFTGTHRSRCPICRTGCRGSGCVCGMVSKWHRSMSTVTTGNGRRVGRAIC